MQTHIGGWSHAHGQAGMTGIGFLDPIDGQGPDGVDAEVVEFGASLG